MDCYAFTTAGEIFRMDPDTGRIISQTSIPNVRGLAWTSDHSHLLVGARGQVLLLKPQDLTVSRTFTDLSVGQTFYPVATPDGRSLLVPAVLDGVLLVMDAKTGEVRKRIATGSPLQAAFDAKYAWISNVKVPTSMLPPEETGRLGGLIRLDLSTFEFQVIANTEDANGIAVIP
jgi:outer membrane protein assembly factor BamB